MPDHPYVEDQSRQSDAAAPPVDLDHLLRQTAGDENLERDVLALFLHRSSVDLDRLRAVATVEERRQIAHLMVGSARAIGAGTVARLAEVVMEAGDEAVVPDLAELEAAVGEAQRFVSERLSG